MIWIKYLDFFSLSFIISSFVYESIKNKFFIINNYNKKIKIRLWLVFLIFIRGLSTLSFRKHKAKMTFPILTIFIVIMQIIHVGDKKLVVIFIWKMFLFADLSFFIASSNDDKLLALNCLVSTVCRTSYRILDDVYFHE